MKYIFLLIISVLISSCEDYLNINKTNQKIVKLVQEKYKLSCFGTGVASPCKIKSFLLSFYIKGKYSQDEARELIVNIVEDIIYLVKDPVVLNNLEDPPFDSKNLEITIMFDDENDELQPDLSLIRIYKDKVYFKREVNNNFLDIKIEPYAEAYFKVYGTYPPERGN